MKTLREYTRLAKERMALRGPEPRGELTSGFTYDHRPQRLCDVVKFLVYEDSWKNWRSKGPTKEAKLRFHQDFIEVYGRDAYLDHLIGLSEDLPVDEIEGPAAPNTAAVLLEEGWSPEAHLPEGVAMWDQGLGYVYDDEKTAPPGALYLMDGRQELFDRYLKSLRQFDHRIQVVLARKPEETR